MLVPKTFFRYSLEEITQAKKDLNMGRTYYGESKCANTTSEKIQFFAMYFFICIISLGIVPLFDTLCSASDQEALDALDAQRSKNIKQSFIVAGKITASLLVAVGTVYGIYKYVPCPNRRQVEGFFKFCSIINKAVRCSSFINEERYGNYLTFCVN